MRILIFLACLAAAAPCLGGEAIPQVELQALDRAISRELNQNVLGSQVLGDLQRLRHRLERIQHSSGDPRHAALAPLAVGEDSIAQTLAQLEAEAGNGNRSALRSLALYQVFLGNPETALRHWERLGQTSAADTSHQILSAYLKLALGEYNAARAHLDEASRLMDTRTQLVLSEPVFCENIGGYRLYDRRGEKDFLPGEDTLVYVEVDGADFVTLPDGDVECRLMFGLKLTNDSDRVVWSETSYGEYSPLFNGPVRDLHTALTWRVPNDLVPGVYALAVEAVEESSKRRGESRIEFTVARRATNSAPRPGANALTPDMRRSIQDAQRQFPGTSIQLPPQKLPSQTMEFENRFKSNDELESEYRDLIKRYERMQGVN